MNRRDLLIYKYATWNGDPQTEPDGDLDEELDNYDYYNELSDDDD